MAVCLVDMKAGFGRKRNAEKLMTTRNINPIKRNTSGSSNLTSNHSMSGLATNLPSPKPVMARPEAKPL